MELYLPNNIMAVQKKKIKIKLADRCHGNKLKISKISQFRAFLNCSYSYKTEKKIFKTNYLRS